MSSPNVDDKSNKNNVIRCKSSFKTKILDKFINEDLRINQQNERTKCIEKMSSKSSSKRINSYAEIRKENELKEK